jgi:hypothetical protein
MAEWEVGALQDEKGGTTVNQSCCTHFIVTSVEVAHLSLPIFFLAFMACDGRETVECAWGQGAALLGSECYQNDQRDLRKGGKWVYLGGTHGVEGAVLAEKSAYEAMSIYRQHAYAANPVIVDNFVLVAIPIRLLVVNELGAGARFS